MKLCLASTSIYRQELLNKLFLSFTTTSAHIDETPLPNESAQELVVRLAIEKAKAVAHTLPADTLIIGSDQVASLEGRILGKPGNFDKALAQLQGCRNKKVCFYTGLAVYNNQTGECSTLLEPFNVHFRDLTDEQLSTYLNTEQPWDCAGSFKSEGLGITLFNQLEGRDPNSLIGLPLIGLQDLLNQQGFDVFAHIQKQSD